MIEMLGVLAIVGVLSAGGIAGYSMAMQSYRTTQIIEKTHLIATRVRSVYKGDYSSGVSKDNMIKSGKLSANDFQHPFGGLIDVGTSLWGNTMFHVSLGKIPSETCVDLLQTDWGGPGVFEGVRMISDADRRMTYSNGGTWPVTAADAIAYCTSEPRWFDIVFR